MLAAVQSAQRRALAAAMAHWALLLHHAGSSCMGTE